MNRLPLALIWLLAAIAGALPATRPAAGWRLATGIRAGEPPAVPSLFKPVRVERLSAVAPGRPSAWRHTSPYADLALRRGLSDLESGGRVERSPRHPTLLLPASRLGAPRFPTGPPAA
jgi:hypothetical protein